MVSGNRFLIRVRLVFNRFRKRRKEREGEISLFPSLFVFFSFAPEEEAPVKLMLTPTAAASDYFRNQLF